MSVDPRIEVSVRLGAVELALSHRQYVYCLHLVAERLTWPTATTATASTSSATTPADDAETLRFVAYVDVRTLNSQKEY